ncbi:hypothetical protein [Nocardia terpenica]|uniref:Uncharacterized protein n=1 Tax=Nocardia terpenica TaxID=455432 RepID=A0A164L100_9NOCA|nr:hypothetical protein [Nocardia terpenica]KZM71910.1 hypothetical protein AWN90_37260 [Nocardia terpenica]NQE86526.1 hypothetical protein [Nocardia terpenica]
MSQPAPAPGQHPDRATDGDIVADITATLERIARDLRDTAALHQITQLWNQRRTPPRTGADLAARVGADLAAIHHILAGLDYRTAPGIGQS